MATDERTLLRQELKWAAAVAVAVAVIVGVIVVSTATMLLQPPSHVERIDPARLHLDGEFVERNLGTQMAPDGTVTTRIVAAQYAFVPRCIPVPAGKPVTIRVTSPDVIHGFIVAGTNVNTMVVPGYVAQVRTTFQKPGTHLMPCHEFCGLGHSEMWSVVRVIAPEDWKPDANGNVSCDVSR